MRPLADLLSDDPAWPEVQGWIAQGRNPIEVLPRDPQRSAATLMSLQVTTRSPMGALAYETGGLLIDGGWLRLGGGGGRRLHGLAEWNGLTPGAAFAPLEGALVVADDVVGGIFALDGGRFGADPGSAHYFAPASLRWEPLGFGYSDLLWWAVAGDLGRFYEDLRWPGWEDEVTAVEPNQGLSLYPPPFTAEGRPVSRATRRAVPMAELRSFYLESAATLGP